MLKTGLRNRFILYFLPLLLGMLIMGGYCIHTFSTIHNHFEQVQRNAATDVSAMLELRRLLLSLQQGIRSRKLDPARIRSKARELDTIIQGHVGHEYKPLTPGEQAAHETLHHAIFATTLSRYILDRLDKGWPEDQAEFDQIADNIQEELAALEKVNDQHLQQHIEQLNNTELFISEKYHNALLTITITCSAVFLLTGTVFFLLVRSILVPVHALMEGARQVGSGNMDIQLEISSGDEFEFLAHEFTKMAGKLARFHGELDNKVQERTRELVQANRELRRAEKQIHRLSRQLLTIQESERRQISLYLHDKVAQNLSSLKIACDTLFLDLAEGIMPEEQELRNWGRLLDRSIKTVRELSYNLRPPGLEQMGLASALADYCRGFSRQSGIHVQFSESDSAEVKFAAETAINIYRLLQEALNNVLRHAHAVEVRVGLSVSAGEAVFTIEDNGCGFHPEEGYRKALDNRRLGLFGMRERVRIIHGSMRIDSAPGQGTRIWIRFPTGTSSNNSSCQDAP